MLKFIRGHSGSGTSVHHTKNLQERLRKEKLFTYSQINTYGFPNKPSTVTYDETLDLLGVGCADGSLYLYGQPGVQLVARHPPDTGSTAGAGQAPGVQNIIFAASRLEIVTITQPNSLHLWEISQSKLQLKKSLHLASKLKKMTSVAVLDDVAFIGTEGGNVYRLNINSFELLESETIRVDVILQSAPESCKVNPGSVEVLHLQGKRLYVGYQKGLVIEWEQGLPPKFQLTAGQLEDLTLKPGGAQQLVTAHGDGSYMVGGKATTPYGPYPCKRISRIRLLDDLIVFAGGMPRSCGDHNTVSVIRDTHHDPKKQEHVTFDLASKVVDFCIAKGGALLVLTEEEMLAIDLKAEGWPLYKNPYLNCIHPSAVTCVTVAGQGAAKLSPAAAEEAASKFSKAKWPIQGGHADKLDAIASITLLTGHEDGSVRIWSANGGYMELLRTYSTFPLFDARDQDSRFDRDGEEDEWPPFRKAGSYDPYTDDPRLAVKKIVYSPEAALLFIGGTAGQVVILDTAKGATAAQQPCKITKCNLVSHESGFAWKGHEQLETAGEPRAVAVLQIHPPASITALVVEPACNVVAVGTAHGFLLYDYKRRAILLSKSTLCPNDLLAAGDTPISRRKSIKKSLRESFRRLRKGRASTPGGGATIVGAKSNERAIEARSPSDESFSSMVRCLTIAKTFVVSSQAMHWTLWVGLNRGTVQVYILAAPTAAGEPPTPTLAKEIHLRHGAPILDMIIIDNSNRAVGIEGGGAVPAPVPPLAHKVLICSEEQLKLFTLPSLRPYGKLKLTALEGCKLRRISVAKFSDDPKDNYLLCLTNTGDVAIVSIPDLRRFFTVNCLKREDISGITSFTPTPSAEAIYMKSSSELQRVSFSQNCVRPPCGPLSADQINENDKGMLISNNIHDESTDDITLDSIRDLTQNISISESLTSITNSRIISRNGNGGISVNTSPAPAASETVNGTNEESGITTTTAAPASSSTSMASPRANSPVASTSTSTPPIATTTSTIAPPATNNSNTALSASALMEERLPSRIVLDSEV